MTDPGDLGGGWRQGPPALMSTPSLQAPQPPPGRSKLPFLLALLIAITLVGGGLWFVMIMPGNPWGQSGVAHSPDATPSPTTAAKASPSVTPSATPSATGSSPAPTPAATGSTGPTAAASIDPAILAQIRAVMDEVPPIRGLTQLRDVPFRFITQDQFVQEFHEQFVAANPADQLAAQQALWQRLGLLKPTDDLSTDVQSLYESQVAAFYDPDTAEFTVVTRPGFTFGPEDEVVVAHEFDHALQDQHFGLKATEVTDPTQGDRANAQLALTEGDATVLMVDWATEELSPTDLLGLASTSPSPADQQLLDSMPPILQRELLYPYLDGENFVLALQGNGGWAAVDKAWGNPPTTTEQILHPQKYLDGENPVPIQLPDLAARLGAGWKASDTDTLGELVIGVWVADGASTPSGIPGVPATLANAQAAAGWGEDRIVSLDGPNGRWAVAWQTDWDTATDATEFVAAGDAAMADLPFPHVVDKSSFAGELQSPVEVLLASDDATLSELKAALR